MIVDKNGEIISKKNESNSRHSWQRYDIKEWHCVKCNCIKILFGDKMYKYSMNNMESYEAPKCDNSEINIIETNLPKPKLQMTFDFWDTIKENNNEELIKNFKYE